MVKAREASPHYVDYKKRENKFTNMTAELGISNLNFGFFNAD